uniref:Uncharacterized protein n=1 Tax=uncultured Chloroflexota bacterium TaxID=166587 RepID=H5SLB2_9CHLR|nr:hypothetical protein HGMM_F45G04C21 [uncultured Chloroflexota bacterium]
MSDAFLQTQDLVQERLPNTPLQAEWHNLRALIGRLFDYFLDSFFDLSPSGEQRRRSIVMVTGALLFTLFLLITLRTASNYPLQDFFSQLLNPTQNLGAPLLRLLLQFFLFILKDLLIFLLPFIIALHFAALYLSDLFELEDVGIARQFILGTSLFGSSWVLHISEGEVEERDRRSPLYLIGGPGIVQVALDSATLFELPDGRPHVIGPTAVQTRTATNGEHGEQLCHISGFERLRLPVIDLRDQFLGSPGGEPEIVSGYSRDGIPIEAHDIRFLFSISRGGQVPTLQNPYPFDERAVEALIYGLSSRVQEDERRPSVLSTDWKTTMRNLIRTELSNFISTHPLNEFLASYGEPEIAQMEQRKLALQEGLSNIDPQQPASPPKSPERPPEFTPRPQIKNLFDRFASSFSNTARQRGVELYWVGLGTWKTPAEIVPQHHEEAWKISRENLRRGNEEALEALEKEAEISELLRRIQSVPLGTFNEYANEPPRRIKRALLQEYCEQIKEARDLLLRKHNLTIEELEKLLTENVSEKLPHPSPLTPQEIAHLTLLRRAIELLEQNAHYIMPGTPSSQMP